ncbi:MAG: hypothetical protein GY757_34265 [bacterium]|nr:hypothetical protein [bacterium]
MARLTFPGNRFLFPSLFLLIFFLFFPVLHGDNPNLLEYRSGQTLFYADESYTLSWSAGQIPRDSLDSLLFSIRYANHTILNRTISPRSDSGPTVTFRYPQLRPGIIVKAEVSISSGNTSLYNQTVYFASKTPAPRPQLPKIGIMDHSRPRYLASFLKHSHIPFTKIDSPKGFTGKWIICSGLNFNGPGVLSQLTDSARKGVSILILPPYKGRILLPGYEKGLHLAMGDEALIKKMDNRLNPLTANTAPGSVFFKPGTIGNKAAISFEKTSPGFTWLQFEFKHATIIFCGWDLGILYLKNPFPGMMVSELVNSDSTK